MNKQAELDSLLQDVAKSGENLTVSDRRAFLRKGATFLGAATAAALSAPSVRAAMPPTEPAYSFANFSLLVRTNS